MRGEQNGRLDPLGDIDVQRALALARARESYPLLPRETLVQYCEAAWEAARRADPRGRDLLGAFDRALLTIAWTHRRTGGRVPLHELVEQTIPRIALQPFLSTPAVVVEDELETPVEEVPAVRRPAWRRPLLRVPFTSPLPVGAAVAAGAIGLTLLHETRVLPIGPLEQSANDDVRPSGDSEARAAADKGLAPAVEAPLASTGVVPAPGVSAFAAPAGPASGASGAGATEGSVGAATDAGGTAGGATAADADAGGTTTFAAAAVTPAVAQPVAEPAPVAPTPAPAPPTVTLQMPEPKIVLSAPAPPRAEPLPEESDEPEAPVDDPQDAEPPAGSEPPEDENGESSPGDDEGDRA